MTFLPFSENDPTETTGLLIRNQLPDPSFSQLLQDAPTNEKLTEAEAAGADEQVLGPYYPKLSWSTVPALERAARQGH